MSPFKPKPTAIYREERESKTRRSLNGTRQTFDVTQFENWKSYHARCVAKRLCEPDERRFFVGVIKWTGA